jgi:hypothetical protein
MAEIVNLRTARKQREREDREKQADSNRAKFGRSKAEKKRTKLETELADKVLDSHKRES